MKGTKKHWLFEHQFIFICILGLYIGLRGLTWSRIVLFEDTDSIFYLNVIKDFLHLNFDLYLTSPDTTPFYPFWGAFFSIPGWSIETGARLTSFVFSTVLFIVLYQYGNGFLKKEEVLYGLLLLAFCPVAIALSIGILTEPSYVATIYIGLFLFWKQYRNPTIGTACLLGLILGASFLNRVEGIMFLAIIPFWQVTYYLFGGRRHIRLNTILKWSLAYLTVFVLVVAPQIYKVSQQLGMFSLNGRQVWSVVFHMPLGDSEIEKISGLDFSPKEINIGFLLKNPMVLKEYHSGAKPVEYIKTVVREFNILYQYRLGELIGPFVFVFFGFGLLSLFREKQYFNIFLILSFIGFNLVPPLLHNVVMRHILIIAPMIFLISGAGIGYLNRELSGQFKVGKDSKWPKLVVVIVLLACILAWTVPLHQTLNPPKHNGEYSLVELAEPIEIIKKIAEEQLNRTPNLAAQRGYLAYFSGANQYYLPYADYESFVTYCKLNAIDFFYLNHERVQKYPFYERFQSNVPGGFTPIYQGMDFQGNETTLYSIHLTD